MLQKEPPADKPYKKPLDEAASHPTEDNCEPGIVEKTVETVSEYIPAAAGPLQSLTGKTKEETEEQQKTEPSDFPKRPHHDEHIENFVREQHRQDAQKHLIGEK
ncbi:hypothetical protein NQ176_g10974 [Zarea fungicola]|uniref:Uncharacterized protein n=1 Tax=Zarea fungicola TaxID=93591 RepID=A0ACC1MEV8_9HYPO|nr:hypothetical protein NQ176_g10974 [Lecanicillium fungicola]